jgi:hypothetical protein
MAKKNKHRYFVTFTSAFYSENDKQILSAMEDQKKQALKNDSPVEINSIVRKDFGEVTETVVFGESCDRCMNESLINNRCYPCTVCPNSYTSKFKEAK